MPYTKTFKKLLDRVERTYLGKPVPKKYQNRYGKKYDLGEIKSFAYAIAKSKNIKIDRRGKNDL